MKIPHPVLIEAEPSDHLDDVIKAATDFAIIWDCPVNFKFNETAHVVFPSGHHETNAMAIIPQ